MSWCSCTWWCGIRRKCLSLAWCCNSWGCFTNSIGDNSNVQDNCVIHGSDGFPVVIKDNVSIGHGVVIHGCTLEDNVLIGMNATVLNGAHINKNCIVGAGAVVSEGKEFPEGSLILGVPAKAVKQLTPEQIAHIQENADTYCEISKKYKED